MDVTPPASAFKAMEAFVQSTVGDKPTDDETSSAAEKQRERYTTAMDFLHNFFALACRHGVAQYLREGGRPVQLSEVKREEIADAVRKLNS